MSCPPTRPHGASDPHQIAHQRRIQAAWYDYLATVQDAPRRAYDEIESTAWARLQRRLERNDERLAAARQSRELSTPPAHR